jgi:hypothetical protein
MYCCQLPRSDSSSIATIFLYHRCLRRASCCSSWSSSSHEILVRLQKAPDRTSTSTPARKKNPWPPACAPPENSSSPLQLASYDRSGRDPQETLGW